MNTAILLAAGKSLRAKQNKLWAEIHGQALWTLSYEIFQKHSEIDQIFLVVPKKDMEKFQKHIGPKTRLLPGGASRMESFMNAIKELNLDEADIILDHNAANPHVTQQEISEVIAAAKQHGAAALSHPSTNTLIKMEDGFYTQEIPRENVRQMQTPQAMQAKLLKGIELNSQTDLTTALLGKVPVKVIEADPINTKVTTQEDLAKLKSRSFLGEDSHAFSKDGQLQLGGITIAELPALEANSDGDVILHAIGRALAQAAGTSFSQVADALCGQGQKDSAAYLNPLLEELKILNASIHIEAQKPHIDGLPLKASLAKILKISESKIHISAMSGEELTPFGRGEAIRCTALIQCL